MIEAMACGTPVIAYRSGSVPEVVDHQITGFVVENEEGAVSAVTRLEELDRRCVRVKFDERFTAARMTEQYIDCYRAMLRAENDILQYAAQ
jgi:glycosyltransferase involved in cell wall biosynthesis